MCSRARRRADWACRPVGKHAAHTAASQQHRQEERRGPAEAVSGRLARVRGAAQGDAGGRRIHGAVTLPCLLALAAMHVWHAHIVVGPVVY